MEVWSTLTATFVVPSWRTVLPALPFPPAVWHRLAWIHADAWPFVSMLVILLCREEAHRWFDNHGSCRTADRLATAWFVFVGTLLIVDRLAPEISIAWPEGALQATLWLGITRAVSFISRVSHAASPVHSGRRRLLKRLLHRWPFVHGTSLILSRFLLHVRIMKGEVAHDVLPHGKHISRKR